MIASRRRFRVALALIAALQLAALAMPVITFAQEVPAPADCEGWLDKAKCAAGDAAGKVDLPEINMDLPSVDLPPMPGDWPPDFASGELPTDWPPGWWPEELPAWLPPLPANPTSADLQFWWEMARAQLDSATASAREWLATEGRSYLMVLLLGIVGRFDAQTVARAAPRIALIACTSAPVIPAVGAPVCFAANTLKLAVAIALAIDTYLLPGLLPETRTDA
jgi:hypothetical protein